MQTEQPQIMGLPSFEELAVRPSRKDIALPYMPQSQRDSIDQTESAGFKVKPSSGTGPGLLIYRADGTQEFFDGNDVLAGYVASTDANWSLEFAVSAGKLVAFSTTAPEGVTDTDRFDNDAGASPAVAQTVYRIPVIRTISITVGGSPVNIKFQWNINGIYRENIVCNGSKGATVELLKIG